MNSPARVGLVLELRHALQLADARRALEQPVETRMLGDVALHEDRADVGVEPARHEHRGHREGLGPQLAGVVGERERVEVDDAVVRLVLVLVDRPVPDRAQVVADVGVTARLDAREHDGHGPAD